MTTHRIVALCLVLIASACSSRLPLDNLPCPCASGWQCCEGAQICVPTGAACPNVADAGATIDAPPAIRDGSTDRGLADDSTAGDPFVRFYHEFTIPPQSETEQVIFPSNAQVVVGYYAIVDQPGIYDFAWQMDGSAAADLVIQTTFDSSLTFTVQPSDLYDGGPTAIGVNIKLVLNPGMTARPLTGGTLTLSGTKRDTSESRSVVLDIEVLSPVQR